MARTKLQLSGYGRGVEFKTSVKQMRIRYRRKRLDSVLQNQLCSSDRWQWEGLISGVPNLSSFEDDRWDLMG